MNRVLAFERVHAWLSIDDHMIHLTVSRTFGVLRSSLDKFSCPQIDTFKQYAYVYTTYTYCATRSVRTRT